MTTESESDAMNINDSLVETDGLQNHANHEAVISPIEQQELSLVSMFEGFRNKPTLGLRAWNHLILTLDGRDKVTKLLQYLCRLLAWWLQQPHQKYSSRQLSAFFIAERFVAMKNSLAMSRKAFRLGRSMIEIQKIQSLGILQWIELYLKKRYPSTNVSENATKACTNTILQPLRTILHSMIHPRVTSTLPTDSSNVPFWNIVGNSIKSLGLLMFWAADNLSFLYQSGFLDDYQINSKDRIYKRSSQITMSTNIANRSYFTAALAGLVTNWNVYWNYTTKQLMELQTKAVQSKSNDEIYQEAKLALQKAQEKQFTLFAALLKSVCDVLVFSNNAGVDLWRRYRGKPLHEGIHCLCGIVSASVVLYNNYPSLSDLE